MLAVVFLPGFIEKNISEQLNIPLIKETLAKNIETKTGLSIKIQGLRFDLWHGLVFSGIRLYPTSEKTEKTYLIHAENLILNLSYLNLLRGKDPFSSIKIRGGKLNPYALNYSEWRALVKNLTESNSPGTLILNRNEELSLWNKLTNPENLFYDISTMKIEAENIRVSLPLRKSGSSGENTSILKFNINSELLENIYQCNFFLLEGSGEKKILEGTGKWSSVNSGEIHFNYKNFPLYIMSRIISGSNLIPHELEDSPFSLESGLLIGKGSITFLQNGMGMNMEGNTEELLLNIPDNDFTVFSISGISKFHFNTGIDTNTGNTAFIRLGLEQKFLNVKLEYEDPFFKDPPEKKKTIKLNVSAEFFNDKDISPSFPLMEASGTLKLTSKTLYTLAPFSTESEGVLKLENILIKLPEEIFNDNTSVSKQNPLLIHNLNLSFSNNMALNLKGRFLGSDLSMSAVSPLKITKVNEQHIYNQNWNGNIIFKGLSYQKLSDTIFRLHKYILQEGAKPDAKKAEDHGPIWNFGFRNDPLYTGFIRPMDLKMNLEIINTEDSKSDLPDSIVFDIIKRGGSFRFDLKDINAPGINLDFYYTADMELSLPHHEMKMNLLLENNSLSFARLINIKSPPKKVKMTYGFGGDGIYIGDMVSRSWSSALLEMESADLSDLGAIQIAKHIREFDRPAFKADTFSIQRSTEGPFIRLGTISMNTPYISARGSGQYLLGTGGNMVFFYNLPLENNKSGKFKVNILEDESMAPEIN